MKAGRVLVAAAALILLEPGAVRAADLRAAGWWWQAKSGALGAAPLTSPDVPDGGLLVAGAPDGATAIAALRYSLDASETPSQLTLKVATDTGGASAVLAACPAGSAWKPASPGAWEDKPAAACDRGSVNGIRSADGSAWTFAVAPLAAGGTLDVVLVPGKVAGAPAGADGSTFQLAFDKPGSDSLATTRSFSGTVPAPPLPPPLPAPAVAGTPGATATAPTPAAAPFTPSLPTQPQPQPGATTAVPQPPAQTALAAPLTHTSSTGGRAMAALILLAGAAAVVWAVRQPRPAMRLLGPLAPASPAGAGAASAEPVVGGLGRFARPRRGPVPDL